MPPAKKASKPRKSSPTPPKTSTSRTRATRKSSPVRISKVSGPASTSVSTPAPRQPLSPSRAYLRPVILGLALVALGFALYFYRDRFIVATVNGQPITRSQYLNLLEAQAGQEALDQLVTETLILQEADTKGVTVTEADIDTEIDKIKAQVAASGQDFDQLLSLQGTNLNQVRKQVRLRLLVEKLTADQSPVTDEEVTKYLADNADTLPKATENNEQEIRDSVRQDLEQTRQSEAIQTLIQNLQANANIKYW